MTVLAAIETSIHNHPGELVILTDTTTTQTPVGGCSGGPFYHYNRVCRLTVGLLLSDTNGFEISSANAVPTSAYVRAAKYSTRPMAVQRGQCELERAGNWTWGQNLTRSLMERYEDFDSYRVKNLGPQFTNDIIAGDEAVEAYYRFGDGARGFMVPERRILSLQRAAVLLGHPLASMPELDEFNQTAIERLLDGLWETKNAEKLAQILSELATFGVTEHSYITAVKLKYDL